MTRASVLGLGAMGTALAGALLAAGHETTVWNRSAHRADGLVDKGAVHAATPAEAVGASPLVIVCLLDYPVVRNALEPARSALAGRVVVNLTTGTPGDARDMAVWAERQGVAGYLDGGVMAVPSMIGGPPGWILYSGSRHAFEEHERTLAALATPTYAGNDPGLAALYDLALLSGMYGLFAGFLHAVALVGAEGVAATGFTSSLLVPWLEAMAGTLPELAAQVDAADYRTDESTLAMQLSAVDLIVRLSESAEVSYELIAPLRELMHRRVADGHGGDDVSSVVELIRTPPATRHGPSGR